MRFKIFLLLTLFIFKSQSQTSKSLEIDSLINSSITQKNFPGAQLYVKYNDSVLINKSYGYHTYDSINKVNNTHIYDLASLTKVLASTLSIMKLYDENKLNFYFDKRFEICISSLKQKEKNCWRYHSN